MTPSRELLSAPPPSTNIPLPAASQENAAQTPPTRRLNRLLLFLVAVLAFLLASFPVRNSDVWLHLARGRLLAQGLFPATTDPDLAFDLWGNQTWIYDLFCYAGYAVLGDAGLVFGKALLAAGLALLLVRISAAANASGSSGGWCLSAFCISLTLVTMGSYLALQPATVSYLFLALVFTFLQSATARERSIPLRCWPLLVLFLLWANMDRWFVLGLAVVALVWLGEVLDEFPAAGDSPERWKSALLGRGFSFLVLAAACLLNPSGLNAFGPIEEWTQVGSSARPAISPFEGAYFAKVGWAAASIAYFLLLGSSLVSFIVVLPQWRWRRFLPWLGLALLSAWQARTIPFFALAAGPVLAWNLGDFLARRFPRPKPEPSRALRLAQALTVMLVLILVVCAWPGWLGTSPFGPRRWAFDLPPSLERGAAAVRRWHEEGKLAADSGGLHLSTETVYALAWFCPAEKRLRLTGQGSAEDWRLRMRSEGIDHVFVYDRDRERLSAILSGLVGDAEQWPLLFQEGDLAVFGWRDPARPGSVDLFRGWQVDLNRLAFHPAPDKKAPGETVDPQASPRNWWDDFWKADSSRSLDRDEALMHLLHAEALQRQAPLRHVKGWENSQAAALVGAATSWTFPSAAMDASLRLALFGPQTLVDGSRTAQAAPLDRMVVALQRRYTWQRDDAPPALYYLAVRAARRAVAANPEDAGAYLLLGESYLGLLHATRERAWSAQLPQLRQLRQAQASAALNRAVVLRPDFPLAHLYLGKLYQEMNYLDLALSHWQSACRLRRESGPPAGVDRDEFRARLAQLEEQVEQLAQEVQKREDSVTLESANRPMRDRAFLAWRRGLAGKALHLLLESDRAAFGNEGMELELELLLGVGRAGDVQQWLSPEDESALGSTSYHWLRVRALAASGEYTRAEEACLQSVRAVARRPDLDEPASLREEMALRVAALVLNGEKALETFFGNMLTGHNPTALFAQLASLTQRLKQQADYSVFFGLLALEGGETEEAQLAFRTALELWKDETTAASGGGLDFHGRTIAQNCLRWLE